MCPPHASFLQEKSAVRLEKIRELAVRLFYHSSMRPRSETMAATLFESLIVHRQPTRASNLSYRENSPICLVHPCVQKGNVKV